MVLNLNLAQRVRALLLLLLQKVVQLDNIHCLKQLVKSAKLYNIEVDNGIKVSALNKALAAILFKAALDISLSCPVLALWVKLNI